MLKVVKHTGKSLAELSASQLPVLAIMFAEFTGLIQKKIAMGA